MLGRLHLTLGGASSPESLRSSFGTGGCLRPSGLGRVEDPRFEVRSLKGLNPREVTAFSAGLLALK